MYDSRYQNEQEEKYDAALGCISTHGVAVLDVGCGTGLLFDHITSSAEIVVGVDLSKRLLVLARARAQQFRDVHIVQADADHLPFESGFFGAVFAFTVLQNIPMPSRTLSEMADVAKQGARIAVTALKKAFSPKDFEDLLARAGLSPASIIDNEGLSCYVAIILNRKSAVG
jgi:ubiquinone/menaquinone biosynthesis C-methylase UbiE